MVFHSEYSSVLAGLMSSTLDAADTKLNEIYQKINKQIDDAITQRSDNLHAEQERQHSLNYQQRLAAWQIASSYFDEDDLLHDFAVECVTAAHDKLVEIGNEESAAAQKSEHHEQRESAGKGG